jgi:hypothetical protein
MVVVSSPESDFDFSDINCFWDRELLVLEHTPTPYVFVPELERIRAAEEGVDSCWARHPSFGEDWVHQRLVTEKRSAYEAARAGFTPDAYFAQFGWDYFFRDAFDTVVQEQSATQPDGLIYSCFRRWFNVNYLFRFNAQNQHRTNMRQIARFVRCLGVQDFEAHFNSRFIQQWFGKKGWFVKRDFALVPKQLPRIDPREVKDAGLGILACDVAARLLPPAFQSKSSMLIMIQTQILTFDPIQTREESFRSAQTTLRNSHLILRAFRSSGPLIASFLLPANLFKAVKAFSDCLEVSMTFSVTEKNLQLVRTNLTTRGFPNMSLAEIRDAVGPSVFEYLITRAAMRRGHTTTLG